MAWGFGVTVRIEIEIKTEMHSLEAVAVITREPEEHQAASVTIRVAIGVEDDIRIQDPVTIVRGPEED